MKCDCCGRRKKLLESYEEIKSNRVNLHLCVDCSNDLYNVRDFLKDNKQDEYNQRISKIEKKMKKSSDEFKIWYKSFLEKLK